MKRNLTIILALLLLLSSCNNTNTEESTQNSGSNENEISETAAPETELTDTLIDKDFGGATYTTLAAVEQWQNKIYADGLTGESFSDSIYERDREIEDRYKVKFTPEIVNGYSAGMSIVADKLKGTVMAGDGSYDLYIGSAVYASNVILQGVFQDQIAMGGMNFDAPWQYKNANDAMTINNKLYASAGHYHINTISDSVGVLFNKQLFDGIGIEYPYQTVLDGNWTYDTMLEMAEQAPKDMNGDGNTDNQDRFGILSTNHETVRFMAYGMGYLATEKDSDGIPQLLGTSELNVNITDKLTALMGNTNVYYMAQTDPAQEVLPMFANNQGLFVVYPLRIIETDTARDAEDFGIVPLPKYNEAQSGYYYPSMPGVAAFPTVLKDAEMSQIILEALNAYTYTDVRPNYYDIILQRKMTRDTESSAMIDLILEGAVMDAQLAFYFALDPYLYAVDLFLPTQSFTTWWAGNETALQTKLNTLLDFFEVEQ